MRLSTQTLLHFSLGDSARRARQAGDQAREQLSTGKRINRAADDAAGLAIATSLRAMQRSIVQAQRNALDAVSMIQVADQGASTISSMVLRARELAVQSANGSLDPGSRQMLGREYAAILSEMDRIAKSTTFNKLALIDTSASSTGSLTFQVDESSKESARIELALRSLALGTLGRTDLSSGASLLSDRPLEGFTIAQQEEIASLSLGGGPFTVDDAAQLVGARAQDYTIQGEARQVGGAGPFSFQGSASLSSSLDGPFEVPVPARIEGRARPGYDIVSGENDTLDLEVDGEVYNIRLETGYWTTSQIARRIEEQIPDIASVQNQQLVLQATGPIGHIEIVGGTSLATLGFATGQASTAQNGLRLSTSSGSATIYFEPGAWTAQELADRINLTIPNLASVDNGKLTFASRQPGAFVRVLSASANTLLGFEEEAFAASNDVFRYRVGLDAWQSITFGDATLTAQEVRDQINARTPGLASVEGGQLVLTQSGPSARLRVGTEAASAVLGLTPGAYRVGTSTLTLEVNGVLQTREIPDGVYTAAQMVDFYNELFPGIADVFNRRVRLRVQGQDASLKTLEGTLNEALGFTLRSEVVAPNHLKLRVGQESYDLALPGGTLDAEAMAAAINAQVPDLAFVEGGQLVLRSRGEGAQVVVEDGSANAVFGLTQGQEVQAPVQGEFFRFSLNGEERTVHFTPGTWRPRDIVQAINQVQAGVATLLSDGRMRLAPISVGNTNTITIGDGDANARLGFAQNSSATGIDTDSLALTQIYTVEQAQSAMDKLDKALEDILSFRADLGAAQNRVQAVIDLTGVRLEATHSARSRIEDADFAKVTAEQTRAQILEAMSISLLASTQELGRSIETLYQLIA